MQVSTNLAGNTNILLSLGYCLDAYIGPHTVHLFHIQAARRLSTIFRTYRSSNYRMLPCLIRDVGLEERCP